MSKTEESPVAPPASADAGPRDGAGPAARPAPRRRRRRGGRRRRRSLSTRVKVVAGAITAGIGLLASLTGLFDWFVGKIHPPPPAVIDPHFESAALFLRNVPLIDYLRDTRQDTSGLTRREKREPGLLFRVRVRLEGEQGRRIPLHWQMYAGTSGRRLDPSIYSQTPLTYTAGGPNHAARTPVWVPYPPRPGRYTVDFSLLNKKQQPLDDMPVTFTVRIVPKLR